MKKYSGKKITAQINKTFAKLTNESRTSVRLSIVLGRELNEKKKDVKKSGNPWVSYAKKTFPHISKKTRVFCNLKIPTFANKNPQLKVGNF